MDLNNLERGSLRNLQNSKTDFDEQSVWANIEKRKKRRPIFWIWFSGAAALFFLVGVSIFFLSDKNDSSGFEQNKQVVISNHPEEIPDIGSAIKSEIIKKDKGNSIFSDLKNAGQTVHEKEENNSSQNKISFDRQKNNLPDSKGGLKKENDNSFTSEVEISSKNIQSGKDDFSSSPLSENQTKEYPDHSFEKNNSEKELHILRRKLMQPLPPILSFLKINNIPNLPSVNLRATEIKTQDSKKHSFLISCFGGIGYQFKNINKKTDLVTDDYLNKRKTGESILESFAFGIGIDKRIGKNWMIGSGIEMVIHNEQFDLTGHSKIRRISSQDTLNIPSQFIGRSGFLAEKEVSTYYNRHQLINIPLRFSYLLTREKLKLSATASAVLNISQKSMGHIQTEDGTISSINDFFKTRTGLSYRFGGQLFYPLNANLLLFVHLQFEINPNEISSEMNPISEKRNSVRLDLGISKSF